MGREHRYALVLRALVVVTVGAALAACGGGSGGTDTRGGGTDVAGGVGGPDRDVTAVWGSVRGLAGTPLPGVTVRAGSLTATSDQRGRFELAAPTGPQVLRFEKAGHLPTVRRVTVLDGTATAVEATMRPIAAAVPLDATAGGTATGGRGAALTAAAGALVDAGGTPVTGMVDVRLTPFDPGKDDERAALPGALEAETASGAPAILESFGVLDVTVEQNGQKVGVAAGQTVTIRIPAPEGVTDPPATIPIWSFDEAEGLWKEEGTGTYVAADNVYEAEITHFSYWNADRVAEATCVSGRILDGAGNPVGGAHVVAGGVDYAGASTTTADADGRFCAVVRKASRVRISASDGKGGLVQQEVESGLSSTTIPPDCTTCQDVGTFTVDRLTCDEVDNPWSGSCAADMASIFECFRPSGACVARAGEGTGEFVIEYGNGAKIVSRTAGGTSDAPTSEGTYYAADGATCGTFRFLGIGDDDSFSYELSDAAGATWTMRQDGTTGDLSVTCAGGASFTMTRAQVEAFQACSDQESGGTCTLDTGGGGGGMNLCDADGDCPASEDTPDPVCCQTSAARVCLDRPACEQYQDAICTRDADCGDGESCCTFAGTSVCYPGATCPQL